MGVGRARCRELGRQAVDDDLDEVDRCEQVLQAEGAQVAQMDFARDVRRGEAASRFGHQDLAAWATAAMRAAQTMSERSPAQYRLRWIPSGHGPARHGPRLGGQRAA
jgi:hypothetical protein